MASGNHTHALPGPDDILRVEMDNGITVLARENWSSPAVVVNGMTPGGALQEPAEKAGLANFHAAMLMRGTQHRTFGDIYEEIEGNGASVDFGSGGHTYRFGSKSLAEDLPRMLALTSEIIREPSFPDEHVEKLRGQIMTSLQIRAHDTRSMAGLKFQEIAYPPEHPYSKSTNGYPETVSAISRDDITAFQRNLGPRGAVIVVVGAVKADEAVRMVREAFGMWHNTDQPPSPAAPDAPRLAAIRDERVTIAGKTQSDIVMGWPGPARSAPDFQAARIGNSILGVFGLMGRLGDSVREQQGLAYYSYSNLTGGLGPGPWRVSAGVAPDKVEQAIASISQEIRRIVDEPVTADELADNKTFFKGQLVLGLETNEGVAGSIMSMVMYDLGLDYVQNYASVIDAITVEDIQAAMRHYLDPDAYAVAVAGP